MNTIWGSIPALYLYFVLLADFQDIFDGQNGYLCDFKKGKTLLR